MKEKLILKNLTVGYNSEVLRNISFTVEEGEILSLLGPSGEGKTTLLKTIAGLLPPLAGKITINNTVVNRIPAEKRDVVLIFQKPLLFPFLTVEENIGFGLKMKKIPKQLATTKIQNILRLTGLHGLEKRRPHQLSGGQQQRVTLARGLVLEPSLLLLDEPFSNLDPELRQQMRELIQTIRKEIGVTMVFVTHDQNEAFMLSDRIAFLLDGRLRQIGTSKELFFHPTDVDTATFFGCTNILQGAIKNNIFQTGPLTFPIYHDDAREVTIAIRPEKVELLNAQQPGSLEGLIKSINFEGILTRVEIEYKSIRLTALTQKNDLSQGQTIWIRTTPSSLHVLP